MSEQLTTSDLVIGQSYFITDKYHEGKPYVLKCVSVGRAKASFAGAIPTRSDYSTLIAIANIPKYVTPYDPKRR